MIRRAYNRFAQGVRFLLDYPYQVKDQAERERIRQTARDIYEGGASADEQVTILTGLVERAEDGYWVDAMVWVNGEAADASGRT